MLNKFKEDPFVVIDYVLGTISVFVYYLIYNFKFSKKLKVIGIPIFDLRKNSKLVLGKNITLRSRNRGYHINLNTKVKIFTDPNAKIYIGDNTRIYGSCIHASKSIKIGKNCLIAGNVNIIDRNGHDLLMDNPKLRINTYGHAKDIVIGDNVWIGANSIITPGTRIGSGSVIMANSLVSGTYDRKSLIGGVPSKLLKSYL